MKETGGETERYKDAERQEKGELSPPGASWMFVCLFFFVIPSYLVWQRAI